MRQIRTTLRLGRFVTVAALALWQWSYLQYVQLSLTCVGDTSWTVAFGQGRLILRRHRPALGNAFAWHATAGTYSPIPDRSVCSRRDSLELMDCYRTLVPGFVPRDTLIGSDTKAGCMNGNGAVECSVWMPIWVLIPPVCI